MRWVQHDGNQGGEGPLPLLSFKQAGKTSPLKAATAPSSSPLLPNVGAQITWFLKRTQVPGFCVEPADFPWPVHRGPAFMGGGKLQQVTPTWARGCSQAGELPEMGEGKIGNLA